MVFSSIHDSLGFLLLFFFVLPSFRQSEYKWQRWGDTAGIYTVTEWCDRCWAGQDGSHWTLSWIKGYAEQQRDHILQIYTFTNYFFLEFYAEKQIDWTKCIDTYIYNNNSYETACKEKNLTITCWMYILKMVLLVYVWDITMTIYDLWDRWDLWYKT